MLTVATSTVGGYSAPEAPAAPAVEAAETGGHGRRTKGELAIVVPVVAVVGVLAATVGHVELGVGEWPQLTATLLIGAVPIALIGLIIGLALRAETAQAGQAVVFLVLAFVGGVFRTSSTPPPGLSIVSHLSPSFYLVTTARAAARGTAPAGLDSWP